MDTTGTDTTPAPRRRAQGRATGAALPDELRMGPARLTVTDRVRSVGFYVRVLGLTELRPAEEGIARLGTPDGAVVLELEQRPEARPAGRHAGLFHVALLYPSREELARAVERIAATGTAVDGASNHGTHEAIYLSDPDGIGLELAADRPRERWPDTSNVDEIRPRPLDLRSLLATVAADQALPARAADGLAVGHVHLHVGDIPTAVAFWTSTVGFEVVTALPDAAFLSAGGYHHHLAVNVWKGQGVGRVPEDVVGLGHWTVVLPSTEELDALAVRLAAEDWHHDRPSQDALSLRDPWGMELRITVDRSALATA